ncbi:MAG TPA: copper chaperone PCu(A)C [Burkholderiales bacterium]|nr:copper chaperone PCu(A)C [Burkholderiales bacterium]
MKFNSLRARSVLATIAAALCLVSPLAACADSVKIANAWVRPPVPGQKNASAYIELTSDRDAALVAVGSPAAASAELHSMTMDGGVMRMRALPRLELPAGQTVKLAPGGNHIMLIDVTKPLKAGDTVPLVLSVQPSGAGAGMSLTTIKVQAEVRAATASRHQH